MAGKFESKTKQRSKKGLIVIIGILVVAIGFTVLMVSLRENAKAKEMSTETITVTQPIQTFSTTSAIQDTLPIMETTIPIIETTEATTATITADNNSVTYTAFYAATNMTRNELTTKVGKSGTSYFYKDIELLSEDVEWITNPINKEGTVNQGAIYRKMAKLLAGFNMFLNDGSNYCELLTGMPYSNRDDFAGYASNAGEFICMEEELYHILKKFESVEAASGTFDFPNLIYRPSEATGKCCYQITTPKTKAGIREVPMFADVRRTLVEERVRQMRDGFNQEVIDGYSGFIFSNRNGNVMNGHNINRALVRIIRDHNVEETELAKKEQREPELLPHFSVHNLRHTFCTRMCENESNIKIIQEIMGHADISTTMDIYNEATREQKKQSFANLEGKIKIC